MNRIVKAWGRSGFRGELCTADDAELAEAFELAVTQTIVSGDQLPLAAAVYREMGGRGLRPRRAVTDDLLAYLKATGSHIR